MFCRLFLFAEERISNETRSLKIGKGEVTMPLPFLKFLFFGTFFSLSKEKKVQKKSCL